MRQPFNQSGNALILALVAVAVGTAVIASLTSLTQNRVKSAKLDRESYTANEGNLGNLSVVHALMKSPAQGLLPSGRDPNHVPYVYPDPYWSPLTGSIALRVFRAPPATAPWTAPGGNAVSVFGVNPLRLDSTTLDAAYNTGGAPGVAAPALLESRVGFLGAARAPRVPYDDVVVTMDLSANYTPIQGFQPKADSAARFTVPRPPVPHCDITSGVATLTDAQIFDVQIRGYGVMDDAAADFAGNPRVRAAPLPAAAQSVGNSLVGGVPLGNFRGRAVTVWARPSLFQANSRFMTVNGRVFGPGCDYPGNINPATGQACDNSLQIPVRPQCRITPANATINDGQSAWFIMESKGNVTSFRMNGVAGWVATDALFVTPPRDGVYTITGQVFGPQGNATCTARLTVLPILCRFGPLASCGVMMVPVGQCFWCTSVFATGAYQFYNRSCQGWSWIYPRGFPGPCNPPPSRMGFGCFSHDVAIRMGDGTDKRVSLIKEGDMVWNPVRKTAQRVMRMIKGPEPDGLYEVRVKSARVKVSRQHPFVTVTGNKQAHQLAKGDMILTEDGAFEPVSAVEQLVPQPGQEVWNIALDAPTEDADDHMLLGNGIVTADLVIQEIMTGAPRDAAGRMKHFAETLEKGP